MPDFKNGKIYTIRCKDDEALIYVGSTTQKLSQRWQDHKDSTKLESKYCFKLYQEIRKRGVDSFYIELYEDFPCERKEQLHKREGEITRLIGNLNSRIAGRNRNEYYLENREKINNERKEYVKE